MFFKECKCESHPENIVLPGLLLPAWCTRQSVSAYGLTLRVLGISNVQGRLSTLELFGGILRMVLPSLIEVFSHSISRSTVPFWVDNFRWEMMGDYINYHV